MHIPNPFASSRHYGPTSGSPTGPTPYTEDHSSHSNGRRTSSFDIYHTGRGLTLCGKSSNDDGDSRSCLQITPWKTNIMYHGSSSHTQVSSGSRKVPSQPISHLPPHVRGTYSPREAGQVYHPSQGHVQNGMNYKGGKPQSIRRHSLGSTTSLTSSTSSVSTAVDSAPLKAKKSREQLSRTLSKSSQGSGNGPPAYNP